MGELLLPQLNALGFSVADFSNSRIEFWFLDGPTVDIFLPQTRYQAVIGCEVNWPGCGSQSADDTVLFAQGLAAIAAFGQWVTEFATS